MLKYLLLSHALLIHFAVRSQSIEIKGKVREKNSEEPMEFANVLLTSTEDNRKVFGATTARDGSFKIAIPNTGSYTLEVSFIGYKTFSSPLDTDKSKDIGIISLEKDELLLREVEISEIQERVRQIGDTTQYNAGAFKTNPDANAQDLISRMPGIVVQNGKVQAQGEEVKKVLVDGKEFFSDDPNIALQNLPAEIIDKIQVYDKQSDQSELTGFDDGNSEKTINIITKEGKNQGQFGKAYAGYGTDNRYIGGGNINFFNGNQRISILGLTNNINQQNFSTQDILGAISGSSSRGGFRGGRGFRSSGTDNFLVGSQAGITKTDAIGINYSNEWRKKLKLSGSYFFNRSRNENENILNREFIGTDADQIYSEEDTSRSTNLNHRFNLRLTYDINDRNSIIFSPSLSLQSFNSHSSQNSGSYINDMITTGTFTQNSSESNGFNFSGNLTYRHKFEKEHRTFSIRLHSSNSSRDGESYLLARNNFYSRDSSYIQDQATDFKNSGNSYSASVNYTEPVGENAMLMFDYRPSISFSNSDKKTFMNSGENNYDILDTSLSNVFRSTYAAHNPGIALMIRKGRESHLMIRLGYQYAELTGNQTYPRSFDIYKSFHNFTPFAMFRKDLSDTTNIRLFYRSNTNEPSISQLQSVIDNTNPLQLKTGNPDLNQAYSHSLNARYGLTMPKTAQTFFLFTNVELTRDRIVNATFTAAQDTLFNGIEIPAGGQLTRPVNLDGYTSARLFSSYGFPVVKIKSNLNLNLGISYTKSPGLVNENINYAHTLNPNAGFVLSSNISENLDYTFTYSANYNIVKNTLQSTGSNNYFNQSTSLKINWIFGGGFVLNSDVTHTLYNGLSAGFNQNFVLWNAGFGYKFLKNDAAELKFTVYDLLNQNTSLSRTITETYIEDMQSRVLSQYIMLTFTYNLRNFNASSQPPRENIPRWQRGG